MTSAISWYAVKVAPRAEFRVRTAFSRFERPALVPSGERSVSRSDRPKLRRWRPYPLIPGYVFGGFFGLEDFVNARNAINGPLENTGQARDIIGLVGYGAKPAVLKPADVVMLECMTDEPPQEALPFVVGQPIKVFGQSTKVESVNYKKREVEVFVSWLGGLRLIRSRFDAVEAA